MFEIARPTAPLGRGRTALALLVLLGGTASPLSAQILPRRSAPCPNPYFPCPPGYVPYPGAMPYPGSDPSQPRPPVLGPDGKPLPPDQQPNQPPAPGPQPPDTSSSLTSQATSAPAARSANLFGDLLGAQPIRIPTNRLVGGSGGGGGGGGGTVVRPGALNGITATLSTAAIPTGPNSFSIPAISGINIPGVVNTPFIITFNPALSETATTSPFTSANTGTLQGTLNYLTNGSTLPAGVGVPANYPNNPQVPAALRGQPTAGSFLLLAQGYEAQQFQQTGGQSGGTLNPSSFQVNNVRGVLLGNGGLAYTALINDSVTVPGGGGGGGGGAVFPVSEILVPNPSGGGVVGIVKFSEDNSPLPRDRVIFNYDYFNNVPFVQGGLPVSRYQFGFEKTFFDGRGSFEFRLPFATTLTSTSFIGGDTRGSELGNVRFALKGLLLRGSTVNMSAGFAFTLPTAEDTVILNADGSNFIRVNNNSLQLSPYLALLYTPTQRLFAQAWYGFTFDTGGNTVTVDPTFFGVTNPNVGSLAGAPLMQADLQLGYWVYNSDAGLLRGLAPFVELHYAGAAGAAQGVTAGPIQIGQIGFADQLNMSAGITTILAQNATLSVGAAAPLLGQGNRTFDFQIGVRFNYYFGYTARQRTPASYVSSFGP